MKIKKFSKKPTDIESRVGADPVICYPNESIKNNLEKFDPGVQGEHKIKRGFSPTETFSAHWIADDRFREAIDDFVLREERHINHYLEDAKRLLPFKTV